MLLLPPTDGCCINKSIWFDFNYVIKELSLFSNCASLSLHSYIPLLISSGFWLSMVAEYSETYCFLRGAIGDFPFPPNKFFLMLKPDLSVLLGGRRLVSTVWWARLLSFKAPLFICLMPLAVSWDLLSVYLIPGEPGVNTLCPSSILFFSPLFP